MTSAAMHVAHGNGLPVPLRKVKHTPRSRKSSAPPFLQRPRDVLAALDAGPVVAPQVRTVTRVRKPSNSTGTGRWPAISPEKQAEIVADYLSPQGSVHGTSRRHNIGENRLRAILQAHGHDTRATGGKGNDLDPDVLKADYIELGSATRVARKHGSSKERVTRVLRAAGVKVGGR